MLTFNRDKAGKEEMAESFAVAPASAKPGRIHHRPVSIIGWSIAVVSGVLLWALAFLAVRG